MIFFIPHLSVQNIISNQGNENNDNLNYNILGASEVNRHNPLPNHGMHYEYNIQHGHWNINYVPNGGINDNRGSGPSTVSSYNEHSYLSSTQNFNPSRPSTETMHSPSSRLLNSDKEASPCSSNPYIAVPQNMSPPSFTGPEIVELKERLKQSVEPKGGNKYPTVSELLPNKKKFQVYYPKEMNHH